MTLGALTHTQNNNLDDHGIFKLSQTATCLLFAHYLFGSDISFLRYTVSYIPFKLCMLKCFAFHCVLAMPCYTVGVCVGPEIHPCQPLLLFLRPLQIPCGFDAAIFKHTKKPEFIFAVVRGADTFLYAFHSIPKHVWFRWQIYFFFWFGVCVCAVADLDNCIIFDFELLELSHPTSFVISVPDPTRTFILQFVAV